MLKKTEEKTTEVRGADLFYQNILKMRVMLVQVKLPLLASITRASQGPGAEEGRWDAGAGYFCVGRCFAIKCCLYR